MSGIGEERHKQHREMVVLSSPVFESVEIRTHHWMMALSSLYGMLFSSTTICSFVRTMCFLRTHSAKCHRLGATKITLGATSGPRGCIWSWLSKPCNRHLVTVSTQREDISKVKGRYGIPSIALHSVHRHKPSISEERSPQAARFDAKL